MEAKFRISVEGKDELSSFFRDTESRAHSFQSTMSAAFKGAGSDLLKFSSAALKATASVADFNLSISGQAKNILEFRDAVNRLATIAGVAEKDIGGLKDQILATSVATGQMKENVTEALNAFVAKTGNIEDARRNLELYARTAVATGATMQEVALVGAELSDKLGIKDQSKAMGILAKQSDIGAIEFKDLARQGPRLLAAAAGVGMKGEQGVREAGALAQVYAKAFGGPGSGASTTTAVEATFASIGKKISQLEAAGVKVQGRDRIDVLEDIIRKANGNEQVLRKIFDARAYRGVNVMATEFAKTGRFGEYERFRDVGADVGTIDEKYRRNAASGKMTLARLRARAEAGIDQGVDFAAENPYLTGGLAAGGGLGVLMARNFMRGGGGKGGILGLGGAQKVEVVNWPAGMGGPGGIGGKGDRLTSAIDKLSAAATALSIGYAAGKALDETFGISDFASSAMSEATGQADAMRGVELTGVRAHRQKLAGRNQMRALRIKQMELAGVGHGRAVYLSEHPEGASAAEKAQVNNAIQIVIHGDHAEITEGTGTRSSVAIARRGMGR